jgi:hypothetical protein
MFVGIDVENVMEAYKPVVQACGVEEGSSFIHHEPHACTTG